jgi:hypothetical protein
VASLPSKKLAIAYFMVHAPQGFFPLQNRGELAALYSFVFLFLAVAGDGVWSLDKLLWRRSSGTRSGPATTPKTKAAKPTAVRVGCHER